MVIVTIALLVIGFPAILFSIECIVGALCRPTRGVPDQYLNAHAAILIPAHNEAEVIEDVLAALCEQIGEEDRIILVADNCDDNTAEIARGFAVEVIERTSDTERGKGYALAFGLEHLKIRPPDVVVVVDADCFLEDGALRLLKHYCMLEGRAMQSRYLIQNRGGSSLQARISELAVLLKNAVRLNGTDRLAIPAQLTGTGMAFPFASLSDVELASGEIVEDMKLGIDLAIAGKPAAYLSAAHVYSYFPSSEEDLAKQRERWEHGHLGLIQSKLMPLLLNSLRQSRPALFGLMLDLAIPPIAFLLLIIAVALVGTGVFGYFSGNWVLLLFPLFYIAAVAVSVMVVWFTCGRELLGVRDILGIPVYILRKVTSYLRFFVKRRKTWNKTNRN